MIDDFDTLKLQAEGAVLFVTILAPPINLIGPELVRDLVSLIEILDRGEPYRVVVFKSGDPDFFIPHVDVTKVKEYREEAARLTGEASIALLFRRLSETKAVTIAQIEGRTRGAGSEFVLACDMRFAARETAVFSQFESSFGLTPGGGGVQHLVRLLGRGRALEVLVTADDYSADLAAQYGWINRALPAAGLPEFVSRMAHRIASFPPAGALSIKSRVNAVALAPVEEFRTDSNLFAEGVSDPATQFRMKAAFKAGFQTREPELDLASLVEGLPHLEGG
ncbi:enoyl-CoA hydratase/isomerase family protein (plasmid) [Lichenicola cladoniae]|uniref:Enoyl-CoA hydratase/isomerase family protein n=1 Tax=Lichenicola cladoniae TaxID=1484109 RepID=A0A6M8HYQ4_9PROT|nr:enoyl-CoA hydratase/isomerase family protein [Lichenicola cladoniae]NPD70031.1 enoyl-CoA hydratase/isomerase family protein [Acetobacteraceae bacterium]QKE93386.1 enoyl-CoA hydratase/isomerase family protein [Lichenicola cladoniae]